MHKHTSATIFALRSSAVTNDRPNKCVIFCDNIFSGFYCVHGLALLNIHTSRAVGETTGKKRLKLNTNPKDIRCRARISGCSDTNSVALRVVSNNNIIIIIIIVNDNNNIIVLGVVVQVCV